MIWLTHRPHLSLVTPRCEISFREENSFLVGNTFQSSFVHQFWKYLSLFLGVLPRSGISLVRNNKIFRQGGESPPFCYAVGFFFTIYEKINHSCQLKLLFGWETNMFTTVSPPQGCMHGSRWSLNLFWPFDINYQIIEHKISLNRRTSLEYENFT